MQSRLLLMMGLLLLSHPTFGATQDIPFRALTASAPMVGGLGSLSPQYIQIAPLQSAALQRTAPSTSDNTLESRMADLAKAVGNLAFALTQLMPDPAAQNNGSGKSGLGVSQDFGPAGNKSAPRDTIVGAATSLLRYIMHAAAYRGSSEETRTLQNAQTNILKPMWQGFGQSGLTQLIGQAHSELTTLIMSRLLQSPEFDSNTLNRYLQRMGVLF